MNKKYKSLLNTVSLVISTLVYLYAAQAALVYSLLSGVLDGVGLFGISPEFKDYVLFYMLIISVVGISLLYKYYKSVVIWIFATLLWAVLLLTTN